MYVVCTRKSKSELAYGKAGKRAHAEETHLRQPSTKGSEYRGENIEPPCEHRHIQVVLKVAQFAHDLRKNAIGRVGVITYKRRYINTSPAESIVTYL